MRNQRRRDARTALRWGVWIFVVLQIALAVAIETSCPILRDPDYAQKAARLQQRLASSDRSAAVVMLGSSRTVFGLDGVAAENELATSRGRKEAREIIVFNFGLWGAGPASYLLHLQRLLADGIRPDLVLIEVLPTFLNDVAGPYRDMRRLTADRLSHRELDVLESCGYVLANRRWEWWTSWPLPCCLHRQAILNSLAPHFLPSHLRSEWARNPDPSGFVPQKVSTSDPDRIRAAIGKAYEEYAYYLQHFHMGGPCPNALRRLLETCRQQRIPAALVLMPEASLFRGWYAPATLQQVRAFLQNLSREFDAPIVDAREWIADNGFSDSHHLLPWGAAQFSRRLAREVIRSRGR